MCGIYGSVGFEPDEGRIDVVKHRGPDGRGWATFATPTGPVALGHRRLAIIDTSDAGLQPMADRSGRFHLIFNGEIYNYLEIKKELESRHEKFHTNTDSEVLLRSYMTWGRECLDKLRGMFAFLIWDERDKVLFAARDRFGIKPLYLFEHEGRIAFASEIKQLVGLPGWAGRMNIARVHDFLTAGMADHTGETMFEGVRQLRAGEYAFVDARSGGRARTEIGRWYGTRLDRIAITEREAAERFRALMEESIDLHLRSDVTLGSCLSGGLDSSTIVCLMRRVLGGDARIQTVSACYQEREVDEKPFMDAVVRHTHVEPSFIYPRADDVFAHASDITWHQDEPFGSTSIFAQWCVFREASRCGLKVMLDGQGADEQLAGYHGFYPYYLGQLRERRQAIQIARTLVERRLYHGVPILPAAVEYLSPLLPPALARGLAALRRADGPKTPAPRWLSDFSAERLDHAGAPLDFAASLLELPPITDIGSLCSVFTYGSNLQLLLHWEDRNSMAHSIEARVPFVDHPLVEFSLSLGNTHKIVGGDTKRVLRHAMSGVLPRSVRDRRDKLGFATPEQRWFRGGLRDLVVDGVESTMRRFPHLFNVDECRRLAREALDGERALDFTLWRIINLGIWGSRFAISS